MKKILMIPGPIEYDASVLSALSQPSVSHTDKFFIEVFGKALEGTSEIFHGKGGLPFIISGSGTLGMETGVANFVKRDDKILVVSTGYFGQRYADLLSVYSKNVEVYSPPLGQAADPKVIKEKAEANHYSLVTVTHVDTSTGVRNDIKSIAPTFKNLDTILTVDGVCSIGGEEFSLDWGVDVAFTASQKALSTPPGLAVGYAGKKAVERMSQIPPLSFFSDLRKWKVVFESMLGGKPAYFGTPNVNLVGAFAKSIENIEKEGLDNRLKRHAIIGKAFREAISEIGLSTISENDFANTLTVPYLPDNVKQSSFLSDAERYGAVFAGGLIANIKEKYFRIGHMGSTGPAETLIALGAIERALKKNGYSFTLGSALSKAQEVFAENDFAFTSQ